MKMGRIVYNCACCGAATCGGCTLGPYYTMRLYQREPVPPVGSPRRRVFIDCNNVTSNDIANTNCQTLEGTYLFENKQAYDKTVRFSPVAGQSPLHPLRSLTSRGILYYTDSFELCSGFTRTLNMRGCDNILTSTDCLSTYRWVLYFPSYIESELEDFPSININVYPGGIGAENGCVGILYLAFNDALMIPYSDLSHYMYNVNNTFNSCTSLLDSATGLDIVLLTYSWNRLMGRLGVGFNALDMDIGPTIGMCGVAQTNTGAIGAGGLFSNMLTSVDNLMLFASLAGYGSRNDCNILIRFHPSFILGWFCGLDSIPEDKGNDTIEGEAVLVRGR